ncbi:MAG: Afadin and alpha-actinin-binding-domain-containing protein [Benjaminiella poitrasii]|nr:MAG: Afadin and alpha-actinin-binding-domain-containing protein [Benjaminiella poitrasii]
MTTTDNQPSLFDISLEISTSPTFIDDHKTDLEKFCTRDSFDASSNYVNILLTSYGYPVPLVFDSVEIEDKCKIVNCIYSLLNDRKSDEKEKADLMMVINQLKKERETLENQMIQLKRDLRLKEKHNAEIKDRLETTEINYKKQQVQTNRLKEEVAKAKHNMQYMKTQYAHETKRHEQDLAKSQERIIKLMNNNYRVNVASLNMNKYFDTTTNKESDNDQVIQTRAMYTDLLNKSTDRERKTRLESEELRASLIKLYTSIRRLLEEQIQRFENEVKRVKTRDSYDETAKFRLPMDCGGREVMKEVEDLLDRLREEWEHQIKNQPKDFTEEVARYVNTIHTLEEDIQTLLETINNMTMEYEEKIKMYRRFEEGGFFNTLYPTPKDAYITSDSEDSLDELQQSNLLKKQQQKKKAIQDQRKITESAIVLGQQRAQLEAERWAFNEMKRELEMQKVLNNINSHDNNDTLSRPKMTNQISTVSNTTTNTTNSNQNVLHRRLTLNGIKGPSRKRARSFLGSPSIK